MSVSDIERRQKKLFLLVRSPLPRIDLSLDVTDCLGENQAELENPAWMGMLGLIKRIVPIIEKCYLIVDTALDAIPQGRMIESQVQPTLDRLTRQTSVDNISLSTTYFDAESGTVLDI